MKLLMKIEKFSEDHNKNQAKSIQSPSLAPSLPSTFPPERMNCRGEKEGKKMQKKEMQQNLLEQQMTL